MQGRSYHSSQLNSPMGLDLGKKKHSETHIRPKPESVLDGLDTSNLEKNRNVLKSTTSKNTKKISHVKHKLKIINARF